MKIAASRPRLDAHVVFVPPGATYPSFSSLPYSLLLPATPLASPLIYLDFNFGTSSSLESRYLGPTSDSGSSFRRREHIWWPIFTEERGDRLDLVFTESSRPEG